VLVTRIHCSFAANDIELPRFASRVIYPRSRGLSMPLFASANSVHGGILGPREREQWTNVVVVRRPERGDVTLP
jgi:hypothetical protein